MNATQLRSLAAEVEADGSPDDVPLHDVVTALSAPDATRGRAASRLLRVAAEQDVTAVESAIPAARRQLGTGDPVVECELLRVLGLAGQRDIAELEAGTDSLVDAFENSDSAVRLRAGKTLLGVADRSPESLAPHVTRLVGRVNDDDPRVRAVAFALSTHLHDAEPDRINEIVPQAATALNSGERDLRQRALGFLGEIVETHPELLEPHLEQLRSALGDPVAQVRARAAYILSELGRVDPTYLGQSIEEITDLLSDPDALVRQYSSYALLVYGHELSQECPTDRVAQHLLDLLRTDLVAVQENALSLTGVVLRQDADAITEPDAIASQVRDLRSDPVIDAPEEIFDGLLAELTQLSDRSTDRDGVEAASTDETNVFGSSSAPTCPSCERLLGQHDDASFCPACGTEL